MRRSLLAQALAIATLSTVAGCGAHGTVPISSVPAAKERIGSGPFIFVTQNNSTVQVFSYPKAKLVYTLTGFAGVSGACADREGHAYIADPGKSTIVEYLPGEVNPIAVLNDQDYQPTDCAIDPTTGNVAVANEYSHDYTSGTIAIYNRTSARPRILTDPNIYRPEHCGYDDKGNLYVDGYTKGLDIDLDMLPARSTIFTNLTLEIALGNPGSVQWDGKYLALSDRVSNVIYQLEIAGSHANEVSSSVLNGVNYGLNAFWIVGGKVVGVSSIDELIGIWKYPAGGSAQRLVTVNGSYGPLGVTVTTVTAQ